MTSRTFISLAVLVVSTTARAGETELTGIHAIHRHGQTFVTWNDGAEGGHPIGNGDGVDDSSGALEPEVARS